MLDVKPAKLVKSNKKRNQLETLLNQLETLLDQLGTLLDQLGTLLNQLETLLDMHACMHRTDGQAILGVRVFKS